MTPRFPRVVSLQMKTDGEAPSARVGAFNLVRREEVLQGGIQMVHKNPDGGGQEFTAWQKLQLTPTPRPTTKK